MKYPLVDVVAVCYNHSKYLRFTLNSIVAQTYNNINLHIYDDASTDESVKEIEDWLDSTGNDGKFVAHKENMGLCATLNEALDNCSGEYVQFIACDDILCEEKISMQVRQLEQHVDAAVCCSNFSSIDVDGNIIQDRYFPREYCFPDDPFVAILHGHEGLPIVIHSPSALVRLQAIREVGGYRSDLAQEDFYMWLNISRKHPIVFVPDVLVQYRVLNDSLSHTLVTRNRKKYLLQHIEVINDLLATSSLYKKELYLSLFSRKKSLIEHQIHAENDFDGIKALGEFAMEVEGYDRKIAMQCIPRLLLTYWKNGIPFNKYNYFKYLIHLRLKHLIPMIFSLPYKNCKSR
jgi:alpha-1,3-rhamnosyltransferase